MPEPTVAIVLKGWPRLSETFIAQEIRGLEKAGLRLALFSMRRPTDAALHPIHREVEAPVTYLPEYLHDAPLTVLGAWRRVRAHPGYAAAWAAFRADLARDRSRNRVRRFGQALVLADRLPAGTGRIHAHFLHTPASVARYAALLTGLPWTVSAHAKDVWTTPEWELAEKLAACSWAVTCTEAGRDHLDRLAPGKVRLVHHGLDLGRFPPPPQRAPRPPVELLSVGRLVPKKGFDLLLAALARLPAGLDWQFVHVGGGPERDRLATQATELGLAGRITWLGARPAEEVLARYRRADLFVLASRITEDGDRDGLPNVLMEAQSQGLACVSTALPGITELLVDGETGLVVPPEDPDALAAALAALIADPERRSALGAAGRRRVVERFDHRPHLDRLLDLFRLPCASPSTPR